MSAEEVCARCGHLLHEHDGLGCHVGFGLDDDRRPCPCPTTATEIR